MYLPSDDRAYRYSKKDYYMLLVAYLKFTKTLQCGGCMKNLRYMPKPWPVPAPLKVHVKVQCFALGFNIYRSIRFVPYKTGNVVELSSSPGRITEPHSLNMSQDLNIVMFHQSDLTFYR